MGGQAAEMIESHQQGTFHSTRILLPLLHHPQGPQSVATAFADSLSPLLAVWTDEAWLKEHGTDAVGGGGAAPPENGAEAAEPVAMEA